MGLITMLLFISYVLQPEKKLFCPAHNQFSMDYAFNPD
jgi:hypothetical protein